MSTWKTNWLKGQEQFTYASKFSSQFHTIGQDPNSIFPEKYHFDSGYYTSIADYKIVKWHWQLPQEFTDQGQALTPLSPQLLPSYKQCIHFYRDGSGISNTWSTMQVTSIWRRHCTCIKIQWNNMQKPTPKCTSIKLTVAGMKHNSYHQIDSEQ